MTRGKLTEADTLEAGPDARFAELCGPEGADEEESADAHPGYGSLLGLGVRKQAKKPVIVLDPEVAEQAAQVMEINAGQLVVRGGQPPNGFGSLGLGALGDGEAFEALGELDTPDEAHEENDEEEDAALAEWVARSAGSGEAEAGEAAWPDGDSAEPEAADELPAEQPAAWFAEPVAEEAAIEEAALEEPVHEQAIVEQAWLDWARALIEPPAAAGDAPRFADLADLAEPEPLAHTVDEIELAEPELPKHELRQMLAQISRPRPPGHLRRRMAAFLRRLFG